MFHSRALVSLLATLSLLAAPVARAAIGFESIPDQEIPSGKTLVVPIPATDGTGPGRSYTVTVGAPTTSSGKPATAAGIHASIRTGDPHFMLGVTYYLPKTTGTVTSQILHTGTMEFQLLREFAPNTSNIIGGLTEGGFYSPRNAIETVDGKKKEYVKYVTFHRVVPGFVIQGGDPEGNGLGGPGFTFPNEYSSALIFSGTQGQLAMANSNSNATLTNEVARPDNGDSNGSQFFITLATNREALDYGYTIFGQMLRGSDTLNGISTISLEDNGSGEASKPVKPVDITSALLFHNSTDAVLLLSATGVCDADIKVTATSGTSTFTQTFKAHATPDTFVDPPYPLQQSNFNAPNGTLKYTIPAVDLTRNFDRFGYQTFLPVNDGMLTTGTSATFAIPLVSNTGNLIGSNVDLWNGSTRGFEQSTFTVGAGATALSGTLTPIRAGTYGALKLAPYAVATFSAPSYDKSTSSFTANLNWGDGTYVSGTAVTIANAATGFEVFAGHNYTHVGQYPVTLHISDIKGSSLTLTSTANIAPSALAISGTDLANTGGVLTNAVVATFKDIGTASTPSDYTAVINWGDGALTSGTVKTSADSTFNVVGSHTYKDGNTFDISTVVSRNGLSGYAAANSILAHIYSVPGTQPLPPYDQIHLAQLWSTVYSDSNSLVTVSSTTNGLVTSGGNPYAALTAGTDGTLYGTTKWGGANGFGSVYSISRDGTVSTIYSFTGGSDGGNPYAPVITGTDGNLYGTTETDGGEGEGTVFQLTTTGTITTIHSFTGGTDGGNPYAAVVEGTNGYFFGTTEAGGNGYGTIFGVTYSGSFSTVHTFVSGTDGANPYSALIRGTGGDFYGTTHNGGSANLGTIFRLTPSPIGPPTVSLWHSFTGSAGEGENPDAALVEGTGGKLYGTTSMGGVSNEGTVYQLASTGTLTTLHSFSGDDGSNPYAPLVAGTDGYLYGTTAGGGTTDGGTVFKISQEPGGPFKSLLSFDCGPDGQFPYASLLRLSDGFYGTTEIGGTNGYGTIYHIDSDGSFAVFKNFDSGHSLQLALRAAVTIINSGDKASGPCTFTVYADPLQPASAITGANFDPNTYDPNGFLSGGETPFSSGSTTHFYLPALAPGQSRTFTFYQQGTVLDTRLKLPIGFDPVGDQVLGVVDYVDPIGDFNASQRGYSPYSY